MNREDVAMDLTFENLDILRKEVQAAKMLLSECDKVLEEDGGVYIELRAFLSGKMDADDVIALLASQHGEATAAENAQVHPDQAGGAPVVGCLCGMPMTAGKHSPGGCTGIPALAQPSPAQEATEDREKPEIVAFIHDRTGAVANADMVRVMEEGSVPSGYTIGLMTVTQHDRMALERWQYFRRKMRQMRDLLRGMRDRLNAAQAWVAELEKQEPVAFVVDVQGYKRLICASREEADRNAEHFEHRGRKSLITPLYAAPVAQAGQVPEQYRVPDMPERGTQHRFSTTEQACRHDFAGVWWAEKGVVRTGKECRECGFLVEDAAAPAQGE